MVEHNMTAEGLHDVHCSSALPIYASLATLLCTMRNMHTWSPLVSASAAKENRSVVLADYLVDAHVSGRIALSALRSAWKSKLSMPSPTPGYIGASIL